MQKNGRRMMVSGSAGRLGIILLCYLMILAVQFSSAAELDAKCILRSTEQGQKYGISGYVQFTFDPKNTNVKVTANIQGNSAFGANSKYAMHIHEYGDLSDLSAGLSAGPHFVSEGSFPNHGCPPSDKRHTGDMGNWTVKDNAIQETKELDLLELTAAQSIVGRSVVLHEGVDDCTGTNGNSGSRTAFCVIGITDLDFNLAAAGDFLPKDPESICVFQPTVNCKGTCSGVAYISGSFSSRVRVHVQGITGARALHLHQYGDLSAVDGSTTGNDYDPNGRDHNLPNDARHLGDLGNIQSYDPKTGDAWYDKNFTSFSSWEDLLGRSLVIYDGRDNGAGANCDWEGSSGNIIMMCVLGIRNPATTIPSIPAEVTINNLFVSQKCGETPHNSGDDDDKGGLVAGLVIGWLLFSLLLLGLIGFVIYRFIYKRRSFENIYEGSSSF